MADWGRGDGQQLARALGLPITSPPAPRHGTMACAGWTAPWWRPPQAAGRQASSGQAEET